MILALCMAALAVLGAGITGVLMLTRRRPRSRSTQSRPLPPTAGRITASATGRSTASATGRRKPHVGAYTPPMNTGSQAFRSPPAANRVSGVRRPTARGGVSLPACPVCGASNGGGKIPIQRRQNSSGGYSGYKCLRCGCLFNGFGRVS